MSRYVSPVFQIDDVNGAAQVGAKLVFYTPGTTNLKTIYSDSALATPQTNPVTAISSDAGAIYPDIFLDGLYDVYQQDASGTADTDDGAAIWDRPNVGETASGPFELWDSGVIYSIPQIVLGSNDEYYRSLIDSNQGNDPTSSAVQWEQLSFGRIWNTNITYAIGDSVYGSDGQLYICLVSQSGNDPTGDIVNWDEGVTASSASILVNKELTSPTITSPKIDEIHDTNGKESIILTATADAVNEITLANAATGNDPTETMSGDDADVGKNHIMKGNGLFQIGSKRLNHPGVSYGGRVLIETITASSDATIDFETGIDSTYKTYVVELINVIPATDNVSLYARVQTGGSTWQASNYTTNAAAGQAQIILTNNVQNVVTQGGVSGLVYTSNPTHSTAHTSIHSLLHIIDDTSGFASSVTQGGQYDATTAVTGFRFLMSSGNISSGEFRLYGVIV